MNTPNLVNDIAVAFAALGGMLIILACVSLVLIPVLAALLGIERER